MKVAGVAAVVVAGVAAAAAGVLLVRSTRSSSSTAAEPDHVLPAGLSRWVYHRERAAGVDQRLVELLEWWDAHGPWPVVIPEHGGLRTSEAEQAELYARGVTHARTLAATPHGHAGALDLAPYRRQAGGLYAPDFSRPADFSAIGLAAEALGLVWGGRWTDPDLPHVEVPDWRSLPMANPGGVA